MQTRSRWLVFGVVLAVVVTVAAVATFCLPTWWRYRLLVRHCPDGELRQQIAVRAEGVRRGAWADVAVAASARYTVRDAERALETPIGSFTASLALVDATGSETPLVPDGRGWHDGAGGGGKIARVKLPDVADGDYRLRAHVISRVGDSTLDAPLALYAPARVHVVTDRPLYQPGQNVQFRAVVLRARDLVPLDGRPGVWRVADPGGDVVLEEKAPAGPWGVVAGSFPLDKDAPSGEWHVTWTSADAREELAFTVEPFTLPRFRVEAVADRRFYRPGDAPRIHGVATYSSGAPVTGAAVTIGWDLRGGWPLPTEWRDAGMLPRTATTGPSGRFELAVPPIPGDLVGTATLVANIAVVDAAGDRVGGAAEVLLARDGIQVEAVTELGAGLAEGFNNRLYLRVATPDGDGTALAGAAVHVRRAWSPKDPGIDATLDEDGVASLQLDPGPAVNVVVPPPPYRQPPRPRPVVRGPVRELVTGGGASLDDQLALDGWLAALAPCAKWIVRDAVKLPIGLRVTEAGAVTTATLVTGHLGRCVADRLQGRRLPPGPARVYAVEWTFNDSDLPRLEVRNESLGGGGALDAQLADRAVDARDCLGATSAEAPLPVALGYHIPAGKKAAELVWIKDPGGAPAPEVACIAKRVVGLALAEPAVTDVFGVAHFAVVVPDRVKSVRPQATTMLGYELEVTAAIEGNPTTRLRLPPAAVPPLRLRATPVLAVPGQPVAVEVIRGPGFRGELPAAVWLEANGDHIESKVDRDRRTAMVPIAPDAKGWLEIVCGDARTRVFVRPRDDLAVTVTPGRARYAPGQTAELAIATTSGGRGAPAAVGLFGVDASLGQLVTLPGADDLGRLRQTVQMSSPAFGVLDGTALALGRIRGANAAAATVSRVARIPAPAELDATTGTSALSAFDPTVELTDRFYEVLAELHVQARSWEAQAPAAETMRPPTMARLWQQALDACQRRGQRIDDAFGRPLRLHRLPPDLLALTEPRMVVSMGTRLSEDVESWSAWVAKERP